MNDGLCKSRQSLSPDLIDRKHTPQQYKSPKLSPEAYNSSKRACFIRDPRKADGSFRDARRRIALRQRSGSQANGLLRNLAGFGIELTDETVPVPMFEDVNASDGRLVESFAAFRSRNVNPDKPSTSYIVPAELPRGKLSDLIESGVYGTMSIEVRTSLSALLTKAWTAGPTPSSDVTPY